MYVLRHRDITDAQATVTRAHACSNVSGILPDSRNLASSTHLAPLFCGTQPLKRSTCGPPPQPSPSPHTKNACPASEGKHKLMDARTDSEVRFNAPQDWYRMAWFGYVE